MRKIFYTMIFLVVIVTTSNATDYFVDYSVSTAGNGLSWSTALKTLQQADLKMAASTANADRVFVKGTVIPFLATSWAPKSQNYYFSCVGTETQPSQRPKSDKDENGVIEAWEFTYPSTITFNATVTYGIVNFAASSSTIIDGVTMSGNGTSANSYLSVVNWTTGTSVAPTAAVLQNSIIANNNLTYDITNRAIYGAILKISDNGVAKDCLIEKNKIIYTASSNTAPITMISLNLSTIANCTPSLTNAVIRNNYESITLTGVTATDRIQAFVMGANGGNATYTSGEGKFTNCLVYNNDLSFVYPNGITTNYATIAGTCSGMGYGKVTFHNCELANNKLSSINTTMLLFRNSNFGYDIKNNVFWNNQNTVGASTNTVGVDLNSTSGLYSSTVFSNNVSDVEKSGLVWGAATYTNNLIDLAQTNTGTKAPYFSNPTSLIGSNRVAGSADSIAIAQARWNLKSDSYLANKGTTYSGITTDLIGNSFTTTPAAGAYEYFGYYRSNANGNWNSAATWQASKDNSTWNNVVTTPTSDQTVVNIQNGNLVTVSANATAPALTVNGGGQLTLSSGSTLSASSFTIGSDETNGTGTFKDENSTGGLTVPGTNTTTVQQYITKTGDGIGLTGRNWYISSPLTAALSNTITAAIGNGLVYYDGTSNWPSAPTEMVVMKGYIAKSPAQHTTINFVGGTLNTGAQSVSNLALGFNLVGNPYASYVDFEQATRTNVASSIWYRSKKSGSYSFHTYNVTGGTGVNDGTAIIAPMQSFWIKTTSATNTFGFTNAMRLHQDQSVAANRLKAPKGNTQQLLRLQVSNGVNKDEAVVYFNENALNEVDDYDSQKYFNNVNEVPEIFTRNNNSNLVINGMKSIPYDTEIPLGFSTGTAGEFSILATEFKNFEQGTKIILKDNLVPATETELTEGVAYSFMAPVTNYAANRFSLIFRTAGSTTGFEKATQPKAHVYVNANNKIIINAPEKSTYNIYNAVGMLIEKGILNYKLNTINCKLNTGVYFVATSVKGQSEVEKVIIR